MKKSKFALLQSITALILCISMLMGTTFAWFTDTVSSENNIIVSGKLDAGLYWTDDLTPAAGETQWNDADKGTIFDYSLWEPGFSQMKYVKITNEGDLAFRYQLQVLPNVPAEEGKADLAEAIDVYVGIVDDTFTEPVYFDPNMAGMTRLGTLAEVMNNPNGAASGALLPENGVGTLPNGETAPVGEVTACILLHMQESAGNEYQNLDVGGGFRVMLLATQYTYENDSFGNDYDSDAGFSFPDGSISAEVSGNVSVTDNKVTDDVTLDGGLVSAQVPAGVQVSDGTQKLTLSVSEKEASDSNLTLGANEELRPLDVHVEGVAADNTKPMEIFIGRAAPVGLNKGNLKLYHVENGVSVPMTEVEEFTAHNQFKYNPATGDVTLYMATFSEVALVADTVNAWNGTVATAFAGGTGTEADPWIIANADQLAYLGDCVSNDNDNYGSEYYKLISDINIGGIENYNTNDRKVLFYPIGYNKVGGTTTDKGDWYTYGGSFKGVFNGAGHTITGIYQNTWAMVGDYSGTYYNDAMGLFGYVNGGTVKNLTIDNFYSEGEYAATGCVAAYAAGDATFENIAITNSHPQTYNTGVAGIVGWDNGGDTETEASNFTFKNITVDSSNTISALWGSWDVAAAGLLGYLGEYSKANLENCNVSATIDVYNDVCGNYQYYWYRYCGMLIGTVDKTKDDGSLDLSNITATNCTVDFGNRHEYYYCEFIDNSIASYTHDYQFSRVNHDELDFTQKPVVCTHAHSDKTEVIDGETVPVEDKRAVYIPFRQIFGGYGWGVKGTEITQDGIEIDDITVDWTKEPDKDAQVKFETKFTGDFLYRVGNQNTVKAGVLFEELTASVVDSGVYVSVTSMYDELEAMGSFEPNTTDWTQGEITFTQIGPVKVTIQDYNYCEPTVLYLEVVDGYNITETSKESRVLKGWTNNGSNVLLEDVAIASNGTLILSNGTLYGNGFELDATNAAYAGVDMDYKSYVINVSNANIDNVTIEGAVYPELGTTKDSNYYRPLLFVSGDEKCTFVNCHLSGTASPIRTGAELELVNTTLEGGLYANLDMRGGHLTLDNVTTINQGSSADEFGLGIVVYQEGGSEDMSITIKNDLKQFNFIAKSHAESLTGYAKTVVDQMFGTDYSQFQFKDSNGETWVNSGIISMNNNFAGAQDIIEKRPDGHGYSGYANTVTLGGQTRECYVYTFKPNSDVLTETPGSDSTGQNVIRPTVTFNHAVNNVQATEENPNDYCTANDGIVTISMDQGDAAFGWNPAILNATKGDKTLPYTMTVTENGNTYSCTVDKEGTVTATKNGNTYTSAKIPFGVAGEYSATYTYTDPYNFSVNANGDLVRYDKEYTETLTIRVIIAEPDALHAVFSFGKEGTAYSSKTVSVTLSDGSTKVYVMPDVTATVDGKIGSTTVNGTTVYYPITEMYTSDGVTAHKGSWYACFPIFKDAVKIIDYADEGTGAPVIYNQDITTVAGIPSTLKATNPTSAFLYQMNATNYPPPTDPTAVSGAVCYTSNRNGLTASNTREEFTITAEYTYTDNMGQTYYYYVGYHCAEQTNGCVTPDTLITLADGSQVRVDSLTGNEELLVWNMVTGQLDSAPILFVDSDPETEYEIVHLYFSDGTDVKVISEHGFWDYDLNKYVYLDRYAEKYVGHTFAKQSGDELAKVELVKVVIEKETTTAWSPVTAEHLCYFVNGMLSMPGGVGGLFNIFEVNPETMTYDPEAMQQDIETYGLFTYEELNAIAPLSREMFDAAGGAYLKVSIGKGNLTMDELIAMINRYSKFF